jgi:hypothetical protein
MHYCTHAGSSAALELDSQHLQRMLVYIQNAHREREAGAWLQALACGVWTVITPTFGRSCHLFQTQRFLRLALRTVAEGRRDCTVAVSTFGEASARVSSRVVPSWMRTPHRA